MSILKAVTLATLMITTPALADVVVVKSTFDSGADGWSDTIAPDTVKWHAAGGNPGGVLALSDTASGYTILAAPAAFLSPSVDYSALDGKAYISYQQKIGTQSDVLAVFNYEIDLIGPNGFAEFFGGIPSTPSPWITVTAPLTQGDWTMVNGTWQGLLNKVTTMFVKLELVHNKHFSEDSEFLDNIEVVSHPAGFSP